MSIDPALKGTTFGAALEAAERAEAEKRAARSAEGRSTLRPQVRAFAETLRGQVSPLFPEKKDDMTDTPATDTQQDTTDEAMNPLVTFLTPTQITILAAGVQGSPFKLTPKQAGRSSGQLAARDMLTPTKKKGYWNITDMGRKAYQIHLEQEAARQGQVTDDAHDIDLDDPALLEDRSEIKRWKDIAAERLAKINGLHKTLDDMGVLADTLSEKIKTLEAPSDNFVDGLRREWIDAIGRLMNEDHTELSMFDYVVDLRKRVTLIDQYCAQIESQRRLIGELTTALEEMKRKTINADVMFAQQILDELCDLIPEVESYRAARESAVKAISGLKARR